MDEERDVIRRSREAPLGKEGRNRVRATGSNRESKWAQWRTSMLTVCLNTVIGHITVFVSNDMLCCYNPLNYIKVE